MKRILFCLLVIFLVGCIPLEEIKQEGPETIEKYVKEGVGFVKEIVANEYKFTPGGSTVIGGAKIELIEITTEQEVKIKVKDIDYVIYRTQKQEIVNGLDITAKEIKFDPTGENTYAILKVIEYQPNPNEYQLYIEDEITVNDKKIRLLNVDTDDLQSILIRVETTDKRLNKGQTERMHNLDITNINTNPRAVSSEKYAIIKALPTAL